MAQRTTLVIPADRLAAVVASFGVAGSRIRSDDGARQRLARFLEEPATHHGKETTMADTTALLRTQQQQQQQQQPQAPQPSPALSPQPSHVDDPQQPLPGNPPVMPEPTPPETKPHPGF